MLTGATMALIIEIIEADGWFFILQKGSHKQYNHSSNAGTVTILTMAKMKSWNIFW